MGREQHLAADRSPSASSIDEARENNQRSRQMAHLEFVVAWMLASTARRRAWSRLSPDIVGAARPALTLATHHAMRVASNRVTEALPAFCLAFDGLTPASPTFLLLY